MNTEENDLRLAGIVTDVSKLNQPTEVLRYYGAVRRYLLKMTGDPTAAEELANDFAERFCSGKFTHFDPSQGRFRDFIKVAVRNLALDYWRSRRQAKREISLEESKLADSLLAGENDDQAFAAACRDDYLERSWAMLEQVEKADGRLFFTVLKLKVAHPDLRSDELARRFGADLPKPITADAFRKTLQRARSLFSDLLLDVVARNLPSNGRIDLEDELVELKLLDYCKSALDRRKKE